MKNITLEFTPEELALLASLASDQLFRREFIDPKMPGHRKVPGELVLGKSLVERLRAAHSPDRQQAMARRSREMLNCGRSPNAV